MICRGLGMGLEFLRDEVKDGNGTELFLWVLFRERKRRYFE